ncbi:MAG: sporulation protein YqfD [Christensenellaceae bacterium]|jgi:similar to stage IV sporulation protein|nr:sporulation protein YqfD [Christensenellaceae bacterium]
MLDFILGYVRVEIKGLNLEKFIAQLMKQNITIKNLVRPEYNRILLSTPITDKHKLFAQSSQMCYTITVQKTSGLCGLGLFLKRKIGVSLGLVCVMLLLIVSNLFVFSVKVYGTQNVTSAQIIEFLDAQNIKKYSLKTDIDHNEVERLLISQFDLSMCSVIIWGGSLIVNIKEKINGV